MLKLTYKPYFLKMNYPFRIADNIRTGTPIMLVKLSYQHYDGFGEAAMPPRYGEDLQTAIDFLNKVNLDLFEEPFPLAPILNYIDTLAPGNPAIKAAIDIALHDLWGKVTRKAVHELYGLVPTVLHTAKTISIESPKVMAARVSEAEGFRYLKIKLGTDHDRDIIEAIRHVTDKPLYIDANQGWTDVEKAAQIIDWLARQNCILIEQPMPKHDYEGMQWLKTRSALPIIGDEGIQRLADVDDAPSFYHGINVKLMKSTGIKEGYDMLIAAKNKGLRTMIGCMSETSCAIAAAAHLGSLAEFIDLDGNLGVSNDPYTAFPCINGGIEMDNTPGIGLKNVSWNGIEPLSTENN